MAITDWPANERPREKLLSKGAYALSDAELLAIFLRTGCTGKSAVDLARELLTHFGGLRPLLSSSQTEFCRGLGLGSAKYAQLQAVLEMSRRHFGEQLKREQHFTSSRAVKNYLQLQLRDRSSEVFAALFLDSQHHLIAFDELFQGTIDGAAVYPREVVKRALSHNAAAVIFAHNHPSGIAEPSNADHSITQRLKDALQLVDIRTLDHLIVGESHTTSFAENGWL
ncbi:RadC family protein [Teredinibacter haidensis]|uniref:RadC family protein n=1 Tax=Teredinibacter haidensis TaxID=2731755 RepID=UPI000948945A|nr:DNA repair protein RadC [Teredinibacter haidensis]